jgi:hypothetical protein
MTKTLREILEAAAENNSYELFSNENRIDEEEGLSMDYYYSNLYDSPNGGNVI